MSAFGRRAPLDVHRVVVLEEHDADLRQPPPRQLQILWLDIGSQGDGADEEPVLPHRSTNGDWPEVDLFSLACFGAAFPLRLREYIVTLRED